MTTTPNPNLDPNPDPPQSSSPPPARRPQTPAPGWRANIAAAMLDRLRDLLELVLLPAVCAAVLSAITWLIWYYMAVPCTPHFTDTTYCYPTPNARYINLEIWGRCLTYGGLGAALGGGLNIVVFTRERNARRNVEYHYDRLTEWIIEDRELAREERERDREERLAQLQQQSQQEQADRERQESDRQRDREERQAQLEQQLQENAVRWQQEQEERELRLQREQADRERQESDRQLDREERSRMLEMLTASHQQTMTLMGELIAELREQRQQRNGSNGH